MITNTQSGTTVDEIAEGIYRISTPVHLLDGFTFNQYLVVDEKPLLFHSGPRRMFPLVREAVGRARSALGPLHVLVNNAGVCSFFPFETLDETEWDRMFAVHVKGAFHCTKAALPDMIAAGWGRIVNLSSVGGLKGAPALTHYAAAKAALVGFTRALSTEVGVHGVTVNAIAPGLIDTPLLVHSRMPQAIIKTSEAQLPVRRIGQPEDIAAACAYLVSPEAGYVTGQVLSPNGGGHTW